MKGCQFLFTKFFLIVCFLSIGSVYSLGVGSLSKPSVSEFVTFSAAADNEISGFVAMDNGFAFDDKTVSCTFNAQFSVSGPIKLRGGSLFLKKDLSLDTQTKVVTSGKFMCNGFAVKLLSSGKPWTLPTLSWDDDYLLKISSIDEETVTSSTYQLDWSYDGKFCVVTTKKHKSRPELVIYSFDGVNLTSASHADFSETLLNVVWHPTGYFLLGAGSQCVGLGNNIKRGAFLYYFNPTNYTLHRLAGVNLEEKLLFTSAAWHPAGTYFALIERSDSSKSSYLRIYSFTQTGVVDGIPTAEVSLVASAFLGQKSTINQISMKWDATAGPPHENC